MTKKFEPSDDLSDRRAIFINEIELWSRNRREVDRLSRERLAGLEGFERLLALRQSLLDNIAFYYEKHGNADAAPGVLALVTYLSDNKEGCCTLSVERIAAFLSRDPRRIRDAIARLEHARCISVERRAGATSRALPWVHHWFGSSKDPLIWMVDARAPAKVSYATPDANVTPDTGVTPSRDKPLTPPTHTPDTGVTAPLTRVSPNTSNNNTSKETEIIDAKFDDFWRAFPEGRKQAKGEARDTFRRIVLGKHRNGLRAKAETLITAAARYAASKPDPEFTPMPTTWLNGGRWEDMPAGPVVAAPGDPEPVAGKAWGWWRAKEDRLRALGLERWRNAIIQTQPNGTWPWWSLGAPPGHAECVVPPELVREFGFEEIYRGKVSHQ
jgi:hypothetical protein